jgi:hypothetical protein
MLATKAFIFAMGVATGAFLLGALLLALKDGDI